ncbi:MAG: hypothetical protein AAGA50_05800 [Pseudomonadota bacterium]
MTLAKLARALAPAANHSALAGPRNGVGNAQPASSSQALHIGTVASVVEFHPFQRQQEVAIEKGVNETTAVLSLLPKKGF